MGAAVALVDAEFVGTGDNEPLEFVVVGGAEFVAADDPETVTEGDPEPVTAGDAEEIAAADVIGIEHAGGDPGPRGPALPVM